MAWFSVWLPLLLQLVIPLRLLVWLGATRHASRAAFGAVVGLVGTYVLAIGMTGLWLVLPWYLPIVYGALLAGVVVTSWGRLERVPRWPRSPAGRVLTLATAALAVVMVGIIFVALDARRSPTQLVDVAFPLDGGTYLVVNGGSRLLVNAHLGTLEGERFAPYRGQSYGVDLVRIDRLGLRAGGLLPSDPTVYAIFDDPVGAPCHGRVVATLDGVADMPPPQTDRAHMAGNHVIVECGSVWLVLGHLRNGSVEVAVGQIVETGQRLGRVGNSGNTGEPHLHIHAQRPGSAAAPLGGVPVPIRLSGRFLIRNDHVSAP
jgi:hypothetical protein